METKKRYIWAEPNVFQTDGMKWEQVACCSQAEPEPL